MSEKKIETKTIKTAEPIEDQTSFPEVKQYPEAPAPAPQVPPAEVGEAIQYPDSDLVKELKANLVKDHVEKHDGTKIPIYRVGDPIKSGDYIKLDEPVAAMDIKGLLKDLTDKAGWKSADDIIRPLTDSERMSLGITGPVSIDKFNEFKFQVLAAFKHLGLDCRRHFTE